MKYCKRKVNRTFCVACKNKPHWPVSFPFVRQEPTVELPLTKYDVLYDCVFISA